MNWEKNAWRKKRDTYICKCLRRVKLVPNVIQIIMKQLHEIEKTNMFLVRFYRGDLEQSLTKTDHMVQKIGLFECFICTVRVYTPRIHDGKITNPTLEIDGKYIGMLEKKENPTNEVKRENCWEIQHYPKSSIKEGLVHIQTSNNNIGVETIMLDF